MDIDEDPTVAAVDDGVAEEKSEEAPPPIEDVPPPPPPPPPERKVRRRRMPKADVAYEAAPTATPTMQPPYTDSPPLDHDFWTSLMRTQYALDRNARLERYSNFRIV